LVLGRRPLGAILHSSNEPGELSQWLCHDDSTINIVVLIIIIIIIDNVCYWTGRCLWMCAQWYIPNGRLACAVQGRILSNAGYGAAVWYCSDGLLLRRRWIHSWHAEAVTWARIVRMTAFMVPVILTAALVRWIEVCHRDTIKPNNVHLYTH